MASGRSSSLTTGGKRGHTPITGNQNTFLTPAKPVSKKDKKHDVEYESGITSDTSSQQQLFAQGQITTPYMPFYNQAIPQPFTQSTPGQTLGEEITSLRVMFRRDSLIQDSRSKIQDPRSKIQKSSSKKTSSKKISSSLIQDPRNQAPV